MAKQPRKIDPHGETPSSWTLYRLKWSNGETSLIALVPGQELADVIDQVTDPGDAALEVTRFKGPLWITFDAKGEPYREDCDHDEEMAAALELPEVDDGDDEEGDDDEPIPDDVSAASADQLAQAARETPGIPATAQPTRQAGDRRALGCEGAQGASETGAHRREPEEAAAMTSRLRVRRYPSTSVYTARHLTQAGNWLVATQAFNHGNRL